MSPAERRPHGKGKMNLTAVRRSGVSSWTLGHISTVFIPPNPPAPDPHIPYLRILYPDLTCFFLRLCDAIAPAAGLYFRLVNPLGDHERHFNRGE